MFRFPKFDPSTRERVSFGTPGFDPQALMAAAMRASQGAAAGDRAARMLDALKQARRAQGAAFARWAEAGADSRHGAPRRNTSDQDASRDGGPTLDMEAPTTAGGAWTAPGRDAGPVPPTGPDLSAMLRALRERMSESLPESLPGTARARRGSDATIPPGARFEERAVAEAAGSRRYKVYVPSGYRGQALPVVVMLHGCTQDPDDFAAGTRMNALAEEQTFLVAYPEQPPSANLQRCWNWFAPGDQVREGGEPALIAAVARAVIAEFSADPARIYAAGLSAGGAAAAILAATYPDLFAAVGVHSGLACGAARDLPTALAAMKGQGTAAPGQNPRPVPTIVFHGDGDRTVHPLNGDQVAAQALPGSGRAASLAETVSQGTSPGGMAYTRRVRSDASGRPLLEQWQLHGAGHAWSGGSPDGSYTDPRGPDASREMIRFFLAQAGAPARPA
jgi:poly(hydroxyalkanoate) depolymerase family esterase